MVKTHDDPLDEQPKIATIQNIKGSTQRREKVYCTFGAAEGRLHFLPPRLAPMQPKRARVSVEHVVKVKEDTREKRKTLKAALRLPSVDAVIQHLLERPPPSSEGGSPSASDYESGDEPPRGRAIDVREPLYSFAILATRPGMLHFYTGFERPTIELLIKRFEEVRLSRFFWRAVPMRAVSSSRCSLLTLRHQVVESEATDRRQSNEGYRKLDLAERVLMFLARVRRKTHFEELGYQYGCGKETARRYYDEMVKLFVEHFVPRLVFPRPPADLMRMARPDVQRQFPDLLAILDATNWEQLKPENFLENRLSYSAYKHMTVYQVLLGG